MRHLHHPAASDPATPVASYWAASAPPLAADTSPLRGEDTCEVAVIGGGYTGLSAALHLARRGIEVRVLERAEPGWGASGRNGGFCGLGGTKLSFAAIARQVGDEEARRFLRTQAEAIRLVAEIADEEELDIGRSGDGELALARKPRELRELEDEAALLRDVLGLDAAILPRDRLRARGCATGEAIGALDIPAGFGLHPLRYARGLATAAARRGARLHGSSGVERWERDGGRHLLHTAGGRLRAKQVVVATNGYTPEDLHPGLAGRLLPALSNVVTTRPLTEAERDAQGWRTHDMAFDMRNLLHYFRLLPDGRLLLGSRGGVSAAPGTMDAMQADMRRRLKRLFPAWAEVEITHAWRGFVCLAADLAPHVGRLPGEPGVVHALAYHGGGVAMGTWCGRAAAALVAGDAAEATVPALLRRELPRFPAPSLRLLYLRAAYAGLWAKDELL